jgi:PTH1 family peptidyl-tRNA hydrolase
MELEAPYLLMGLGNPGKQYEKTRHNAGFMVLSAFEELYPPSIIKENKHYRLAQCRVDGSVFWLLKAFTFMNLSGSVLGEVKGKTGLGPANMLVICDNMDLPLGALRLKMGGGSAGQKGLANVISSLGSPNFARLYVGIGRPVAPISVADYVLGRFNANDEELFEKTCGNATLMLTKLATTNFSTLQSTINSLC